MQTPMSIYMGCYLSTVYTIGMTRMDTKFDFVVYFLFHTWCQPACNDIDQCHTGRGSALNSMCQFN